MSRCSISSELLAPNSKLTMYDLHTHSLLSDGRLLPSELARRYEAKGYKAIAITDHSDYSNIDNVIESVINFCTHWPKESKLKVFPGIELTHLPLTQFSPLCKYARQHGIKIIVAHGETIVEPVLKGTNRAALESGIDILAHPGLLTEKEAVLARKRGVFLEITARAGHNQTNALVMEQALETGADLIINTDSHSPDDILSTEDLWKVGIKCGLKKNQMVSLTKKVGNFVESLL